MLEKQLKETGKHLIKTDTIFKLCQHEIDLTDESEDREDLLEKGMRQVIQSRLYVHGYLSVQIGYFLRWEESDNIGYLNLIIRGKDTVIEKKMDVRNYIKQLKALNGQMVFVPDENNELTTIETKTQEEIYEDLEADAV